MGDAASTVRQERYWFWGLLFLAALLRVIAFDPYSLHHPDETIQYLEQAHRIVFGYGAVPWEYRYGIRSWLMPLLLVPPMQLGEWINPGGTLYLILPRAALALLNMAPVVAAWFIGRRISLRHAIVAMAAMAVWVECVLFSVQTLSESLAISCFLAAAAILGPKAGPKGWIAAGLLLGLAGLLRFQFAPAIAAYVLMVAGREPRIWKGLLIGGIPVVIAGGLLDLATGGMPYAWILNNFRMNILDQRMLRIGGVSHWTYAQALIEYWKAGLLVIPFLAALAWRPHRALLIAAGVNLLFHQLIGHKEYRYIWFSAEIVLLVAAMGSVELARMVAPRKRTTALLVGLWALGSAALASTDTYRFEWRKDGGPARLAADALKDPRVCGIAVPRRQYSRFSYALLHSRKPVFLLGASDDPSSGGFNAMLTGPTLPARPGFAGTKCSDRHCLMVRAGGCDPSHRAFLYQDVLLARDM